MKRSSLAICRSVLMQYGVSALLVLCAAPVSTLAQSVGPTSRISLSPAGVGGNASSTNSSISANGRFTVFRSSASNLVSSDTNGVADIFLRDNLEGSISRVTVNSNLNESNGESTLPSVSGISPNGFYAIAYESVATNLPFFGTSIPDANDSKDIYVSLPSSGFTERASMGINAQVANGPSKEPSVTIQSQPETVLVAFTSDATNLVASDTNGVSDVFLTTMTAPSTPSQYFSLNHKITRISEGTGGTQSNGASSKPAISGDGKFVVFQSDATNIFTVTGVPTTTQIYVFDVAKATTTLVSRSASGAPGNGASTAPSISYSGTFITYLTLATNIVEDGKSSTTGGVQVMRYNLLTGATERVNVSSTGNLSDTTTSTSASCRVAPNGRAVVFTDAGTNLSGTDSNGKLDVFVRDMAAGTTVRLSNSTTGGSSDDSSFDAAVSGSSYNSLSLNSTFTSFATNLVPNDTEGRTDLFSSIALVNPIPFARGLPLETPPDVTLGATRSLLVAGTSLSRPASTRGASPRKTVTKIQYRVTVTSLTSAKADVRRKVSTRNNVTFRRLPPGLYTVAYRVEMTRNGKLAGATRSSATQQVIVQ